MATDNQRENVWWTEPNGAYVKQINIAPFFADVDMKNSRLQEMAGMEQALYSHVPYPAEYVPDELRWVQRTVTDKDRDLPDAFQGYAGSPVISEALRDVLAGFELGTSQFFECPLYDVKSMDKAGRHEVDRSKKDPRRWFLFHVPETKDVLLPGHSKGLLESSSRPGFYFPHGDKNPVIALNRELSLSGPPIWRDPHLVDVFFFNDAVKRAIEAKSLRTPSFRFKPCLLV